MYIERGEKRRRRILIVRMGLRNFMLNLQLLAISHRGKETDSFEKRRKKPKSGDGDDDTSSFTLDKVKERST